MNAATATRRRAIPIASAALVLAFAVALLAGPASAQARVPRLLEQGFTSPSVPNQVLRQRPLRFGVSHYSLSRISWRTWNSFAASGDANFVVEFAASRPRRFRSSFELTRARFRCGVFTYTRLSIVSSRVELVSKLVSEGGECNWIVQ